MQLIRKLHITEPVNFVMCLLGKKYPMTADEFYCSRLPDTFDPSRAGKRMKLQTPETWETQLSLRVSLFYFIFVKIETFQHFAVVLFFPIGHVVK